jgi:hypothetical protein
MNLAVLGLQALRVAELESHAKKIHTSRKLIVDFEKQPNEASHLACRALRRVLKLVTNDPSASMEERNEAKRLLYRIRSFDPRRAAKESEGNDPDLLAACTRNDDTNVEAASKSGDPWDSSPPLSVEEGMRLVEIQRPHSAFDSGEFVLRPGADTQMLIELALEGRAFNIPTILRLYNHMTDSFNAGGTSLASGPLYSELKRLLAERNALPPDEKKLSLMEELEGRC